MEFRELNVNDHLYFVVDGEKEIELKDTTVDDIKIDNGFVYFTNKCKNFRCTIDSLFKTNLKMENNTVTVFTTQEEDSEYYNALVESYNAEQEVEESYDGDKCNCEHECNCGSEPEDCFHHPFASVIDAASAILNQLAVKYTGMNLDELEKYTETHGYFNKEDDNNVKPSPQECLNKCSKEDLMPGKGVEDEDAILAVIIKENSCMALDNNFLDDRNFFERRNPLFYCPRVYLHAVKVPSFVWDAPEEDVDLVYEKIERWIEKNYPELEYLDYGEDYVYNIFPAQNGITVVNKPDNPIDFNVYR